MGAEVPCQLGVAAICRVQPVEVPGNQLPRAAEAFQQQEVDGMDVKRGTLPTVVVFLAAAVSPSSVSVYGLFPFTSNTETSTT